MIDKRPEYTWFMEGLSIMEKQIITAVRYRINDVYFVDACEEVASTGNRDYWLGENGSKNKKFLFSCHYKGQQREEDMLREKLPLYTFGA